MGSPAANTEEAEQRVVAEWLDWNRIQWCHVPNEGRRKLSTGGRLVAAGMKSGVPDILIFDRPKLVHPEAVGVAIEMKRRDGGRVTPEQEAWLEALAKRGWHVLVARGAAAAIAELERLGVRRTA